MIEREIKMSLKCVKIIILQLFLHLSAVLPGEHLKRVIETNIKTSSCHKFSGNDDVEQIRKDLARVPLLGGHQNQ